MPLPLGNDPTAAPSTVAPETSPALHESLPVSEARTQFSGLIDRVAFRHQRVLLTRHGHARVAIIPAEDLLLLEQLEAAAPPAVDITVLPPAAVGGEDLALREADRHSSG